MIDQLTFTDVCTIIIFNIQNILILVSPQGPRWSAGSSAPMHPSHSRLQVFPSPLQAPPTSPWSCWSWTEASITICWRPPTHCSLRWDNAEKKLQWMRLCDFCAWSCHAHVSERHLDPQRGLGPPAPGHSSVLHPQGHVSGPELQPSQTAAEDHTPAENHPHTRFVTGEHSDKSLKVCSGSEVKLCCFLRATGAREEHKVREVGTTDRWSTLLHHGKCSHYPWCHVSVTHFNSLSSPGFGRQAHPLVRAQDALLPRSQNGGKQTSHHPLC